MYWPFFRSKQEELLALRELTPNLNHNNLIVPVIKPHSASTRVERQTNTVLQTGLRIALILNTNEGAPLPSVADVRAMESRLTAENPDQVFPALEVRPNTSSAEVSDFLNAYRNRTRVFIHRSHTLDSSNFPTGDAVHIFESNRVAEDFISAFSSSWQIILRDGFIRQSVNRHYPSTSYFDDLLFTYRTSGFHGFGDFAIVGDVPYTTGGGQASHVALHLTEPRQNNAFQCRHFVSSVSPSSTDVQTKYFDALDQLTTFTSCPGRGSFATQGVNDYCQNHASGNYPGLGSPKRWSIKHHIELVHSYLRYFGATPWI